MAALTWSMKSNSWVKILLSLAVITGSGFWMRRTLSAPSDPQIPVHRSLGRALATECKMAMEGRGTLMVIALESGVQPAIDLQLEALQESLKRTAPAIDVQVVTVDDKGESKYGPGYGLSSNRLQRILRKNTGATAIVSLLGMPAVDVTGVGDAGTGRQTWIAYSRSLKKLKPGEGVRSPDVVIVPRFQFPSPVSGEPGNDGEWFDMTFQTLRAGGPSL